MRGSGVNAVQAWNEALAGWGIPPEILDQAPESPWVLPPQLFTRAAERPSDTLSRRAALDALPPGGTVLDVGCGAGAASLALSERAPVITGVDDSEDMLSAFTALAREAGLKATAVKGRWPDVAADVAEHDVVVCHHVAYNVGDIEPFVRELHSHARRRVVLELTEQHPRAALNPLWLRFWNLERPTRPTADDLVSVLSELGYDAHVERFAAPSNWDGLEEMVPWVRRWLCLPASRDADVGAVLQDDPPPATRSLVTVWWDRGSPIRPL